MSYVRSGFGAVDPNAGTYEDPNCPLYCWVAGNALDMETFGQHCWPCHNVCPPGQNWDTTALACSGSAPNPYAIGTTTPQGGTNCPQGQTWNANDGQCEAPSNPCPLLQIPDPTTGVCGIDWTTILTYGGLGIAALAAVSLAMKA
jgi:hypothetical protein